jgi:hypothetical protein
VVLVIPVLGGIWIVVVMVVVVGVVIDVGI